MKNNLNVQNKKVFIFSIVGLLLISVLSVPLAFASTAEGQVDEDGSTKIRVLKAKGVAKDRSMEEAEHVPAGFMLELVASEVKPRIINFDVVGGTLEVNDVEYTILEGEGGVIRYRRGFLLEARGVDVNGEEVTLKLAGRYFWMWGRVYVARIAGVLETQDANYLLFLRSAIRV